MKKPSRVFIDTNTLVSGLLFEGNEQKILRYSQTGEIKLVLSQDVVEETEEVVEEKFPEAVNLFHSLLEELEFEYIPANTYQSSIKRYVDKIEHDADLPILTAAIIARADFLVSGNKHFHIAKVKKLIRVVTSKQLLNILEN